MLASLAGLGPFAVAPPAFPATLSTNAVAVSVSPPSLTGAVSRKVHGATGTFDLALSPNAATPTVEPRQSASATIVFTFDKPVTAATAVVTEGVGTAGLPTFNGNDVTVGLTGVTNAQWVTVTLTNVTSADGGAGGAAAVRVGFLLGDVSGNRVVTVADLGQVNAQIAQVVGTGNFLRDVNASGTLTVADKGIANTQITKALGALGNVAPVVNAGADQSITLPATVSLAGTASDDGLPSPPGAMVLSWTKVSGPGTVTFDSPASVVTTASFDVAGTYVLRLTATDGSLIASDDVQVTVDSGEPPPTIEAPPLDTSVATNIADATRFLYIGPNAVQTGVAPGAMEERRAAVLRGRVSKADGSVLPGVTVTILNHPQFGQTTTRSDGVFDMAVNGGGPLVVDYAAPGFLPVQRQVDVPWNDYAILPDVVMIGLDSRVTRIDLASTAPLQVARGNLVTDADGSRQATILFPAGLQATMVLPNGATQPLSVLDVRATEYTVGPNGLARMPAELPPMSAYTYAVELSVDQALAAGAKEVRFSSPLPFYVENFLGFPIGATVPLGYYDRARGHWAPATSGRVVKIVAIAAGQAEIDVDGDNVADTGAKLSALSITDAERAQLASLYASGQALWRALIPHFTPWDLNWPFGLPDGAQGPDRDPQRFVQQDECCRDTGSIIELQNQIVGEAVAVVGTPFALHYQSEKAAGRRAAYTLEVPLSGPVLPTGDLVEIRAEFRVAGRRIERSFPPQPDQRTTFTWDGRDAYGRRVQGPQPITVRIGYVYRAQYQDSPRFADPGSQFVLEAIPARQLIVMWRLWNDQIGAWDATAGGVGGWTLTPHHNYVAAARELYRGDGRRETKRSVGPTISTVAGTGTPGQSGDGGPATAARIVTPQQIAFGPDGSLYFASSQGHLVRKVDASGIISTVVSDGSGNFCQTPGCGDGGLATHAQLAGPRGVAVGPDGSLYIAEVAGNRIRKVDPTGIITTFAGTGVAGFSGDGGPATLARFNAPGALAFGSDGSLLVVDGASRLRRIAPDGIVTTIAGGGTLAVGLGDGGPATRVQFGGLTGIAAARDGSVYLTEAGASRVRRITPDGIIRTVAGTGVSGFAGDGFPATQARFSSPVGVAVGPDDSVYVVDQANHRIRWFRPGGVIDTLAGTGSATTTGDRGPSRQAALQNLEIGGIAVGPDGAVYVSQAFGNVRIRRISPLVDRFVSGEIVPSADGTEVFVFSDGGLHQRTLDAMTGTLRYEFAYDVAGRLATLTDGDGNVTTIERDASGRPTAIVSPFGQRTMLEVGANGFISRIASPAGRAYQASYTPDGLLTAFTRPNGATSRYAYDAMGLLTSTTDPAGAVRTLVREGNHEDHTVEVTTPLGRKTRYRVTVSPNQDLSLSTTDAAGIQSSATIRQSGRHSLVTADGTRIDYVLGPDPRWGMLAPITANATVTTPAGKVRTVTTQSTVTLDDPADPLSLRTLTDGATVNGRSYTTTYDVSTRTLTRISPAGRRQTTEFDERGRVVREQFGDLNPTVNAYDARGRVITVVQGQGPGSRITNFAYGNDGLLSAAIDSTGRNVLLARDADGRLTQATLTGGRTLRFDYDANGNLVALTPPGRPEHRFQYGLRDEPTEYAAPALGTQDHRVRYAIDADRQPLRIEHPDGQAVDFRYDSAGRPTRIDRAQGPLVFGYDDVGRLALLSSTTGPAITSSFDGALPMGTAWSGVIGGSIARTYDDGFRIASLGVNGGSVVAIDYDADSLPVRVGDLVLTRSAQTGLVTGTALGGVTDSIAYDGFAEAASYTASFGGIAKLSLGFTRDTLGRIVARTESVDGVVRNFSYVYDASGRLAEVREGGARVASYAYDANGNRSSRTDGSGTWDAIYDAQDRIVAQGSTVYAHNARGQRTSRTRDGSTTLYDYDDTGALTGVTLPSGVRIDYVLDGAGRRVGKKVAGVLTQRFLFQDGQRPIAELDGAGAIVSRFVYVGGESVPAYLIKGGATYRILADHLGSPRLVVDVATGQVVQRMDHDEFGSVTFDDNPGFQPFGFAGGLYDADTKLVRFGAREYDAETGRWMSKDPIGFDGGVNLYAYAENDPLNLVDPAGDSPRYSVPPYQAAPPMNPNAPPIRAPAVPTPRPPPLPAVPPAPSPAAELPTVRFFKTLPRLPSHYLPPGGGTTANCAPTTAVIALRGSAVLAAFAGGVYAGRKIDEALDLSGRASDIGVRAKNAVSEVYGEPLGWVVGGSVTLQSLPFVAAESVWDWITD